MGKPKRIIRPRADRTAGGAPVSPQPPPSVQLPHGAEGRRKIHPMTPRSLKDELDLRHPADTFLGRRTGRRGPSRQAHLRRRRRSALLLLLLLPVLAIVAVLIRARLARPGVPPLRPRGLRRAAPAGPQVPQDDLRRQGGPLTTADDARFTRLGRWLAEYKLDELPADLAGARGQMSLVGPRPEDDAFVARHADAYHRRILTVRPGIFGLSQLAFARENSILDSADPVGHYVARILPQKVALDQLYAAEHDLWLDVRSSSGPASRWCCAPRRGRQDVGSDAALSPGAGSEAT